MILDPPPHNPPSHKVSEGLLATDGQASQNDDPSSPPLGKGRLAVPRTIQYRSREDKYHILDETELCWGWGDSE